MKPQVYAGQCPECFRFMGAVTPDALRRDASTLIDLLEDGCTIVRSLSPVAVTGHSEQCSRSKAAERRREAQEMAERPQKVAGKSDPKWGSG